MSELMRIGLLGSGSWATALAKMLCENVESLNWWVRNADTLQHIENFGSNPKYIQSIQLPTDKLKLSTNMRDVISASDVVIIAIPSMYIDEAFDEAFGDKAPVDMHTKLLFSAIKGMIPKYNSIPARYLHKRFDIPWLLSALCSTKTSRNR